MKNIRTCIVCRNKFEKKLINRIVKNAANEIVLDKTQKMQARGVYLCFKETCKEKLYKTKALNRAFKTFVPEEVYENLLSQIK